MSDDYERVEITARADWRAWLERHHAAAPGAWAVTHKQSEADRHVPYAELVEEELCFGWVDSKAKTLDERRTTLLFTPRRRGSGWSRPNKERIARLEPAGLIAPAGQAVLDAARADGSWTALDAIENLEEPPELAAALDADEAARRHWDGFPRSTKRATLVWVGEAVDPQQVLSSRVRSTFQPTTRARRSPPVKAPG